MLSKKDIGNRLKELRMEKNLSQSEISRVLSISRSNYSQIELGNQYPTFNTLNVIARFYNKTYQWLLHGEEHIDTHSIDKELTAIVDNLVQTLSEFKQLAGRLESELVKVTGKQS